MELAKKVVVFVGGMGGIGLAGCKAMVERGIKHLIVLDIEDDKNCDKLKELESLGCDKTQIDFLPLDLTEGRKRIKQVLDEVASKVKTFDILVNNSGIIDERNPKKTIDVNLTGLVETTLLATPIMSKAEQGHGGLVLNCASVLGFEAAAFLAVYTATKHGVIGFTKSMAHPLYYRHTGIMHIAFCPGFTTTPLIEDFKGRDTFDISKPITDKVVKCVSTQTADECGQHMAQVIEESDNGSIWISDLGYVKKVWLRPYWEYPWKKGCRL